MAVTATITINRSADSVMGNKRETGGTMTLSGTYDASATAITHNALGLKQVEFFTISGVGGTATGATNQPLIGVTHTSTGVSLRFYGDNAAAAVAPSTELTSGTVANSGTITWRARGY